MDFRNHFKPFFTSTLCLTLLAVSLFSPLTTPQAHSAVPACRRIDKLTGTYLHIRRDDTFRTAQAFRDARERWDADMTSAAQTSRPNPTGGQLWPSSFDHAFGYRERFRVAEAALKLKKPIYRAVPHMMAELRKAVQSSMTLQTLTDRFRDVIRSEYPSSTYAELHIERSLAELSGYWARFRGDTDLTPFEVTAFLAHAQRFLAQMEAYRTQYGQDSIPHQVEIRAGFGNLASQVIVDSMRLRTMSYPSLDALSLLHPLTDDALDQGRNVGRTMKKISLLLDGHPQEPKDDYERIVFGLINDIFVAFPPKKHPLVQAILKDLHAVQLKSIQLQRDPNATEEDLLRLSIQKGGYTAVALAHLSIGTLTQAEMEFFYKGGLIFQLGDDLVDMAEDARDGNQTLWTHSHHPDRLQRTLDRYVNTQHYLETLGPVLLRDSPYRDPLLNNLRLGFKFYLMGAYLNPETHQLLGPLLKSKLPLSRGNTLAITFSIFERMREVTKPDDPLWRTATLYAEVFDKHFLKGQHDAFQANNSLTPLQIYRIGHANPYFLLVRLADLFQRTIVRFPRLIWPYVLLQFTLALNIEHDGLRAAVIATAAFLFLFQTDVRKLAYPMAVLGVIIPAIHLLQLLY